MGPSFSLVRRRDYASACRRRKVRDNPGRGQPLLQIALLCWLVAVASSSCAVRGAFDMKVLRRMRNVVFGSGALGAVALGTVALGSLAVGALAVGALAIGALAVGRLAIRELAVARARFESLDIPELNVKRLHVAEIDVTGTLMVDGRAISPELVS